MLLERGQCLGCVLFHGLILGILRHEAVLGDGAVMAAILMEEVAHLELIAAFLFDVLELGLIDRAELVVDLDAGLPCRLLELFERFLVILDNGLRQRFDLLVLDLLGDILGSLYFKIVAACLIFEEVLFPLGDLALLSLLAFALGLALVGLSGLVGVAVL